MPKTKTITIKEFETAINAATRAVRVEVMAGNLARAIDSVSVLAYKSLDMLPPLKEYESLADAGFITVTSCGDENVYFKSLADAGFITVTSCGDENVYFICEDGTHGYCKCL